MWTNLYSITFTQTSVISFLTVNTPFPLQHAQKNQQQKHQHPPPQKKKPNPVRWFSTFMWLVGYLTNRKPILVILFLVLLSIVQKNLTIYFPTYCIMFSQQFSSCVQMFWPLFFHYYFVRIRSMKTLTHLYVTKCIYIIAYCINNLKRQSVFSRPIVSYIGHETSTRLKS